MDLDLAFDRSVVLRQGRSDGLYGGGRSDRRRPWQLPDRLRGTGRQDPCRRDRRRGCHRGRPRHRVLRGGGRHRQHRDPHGGGGSERGDHCRQQRRRDLYHKRRRVPDDQCRGRPALRYRDAAETGYGAECDLDRHQQRHCLYDAGLSGDHRAAVPLHEQL